MDLATGKSSLVHVSELDVGRTADPTALWKAGEKIDVNILMYDKASGRCKLSRYLGSRLIIAHPRVINPGPRLNILRLRAMNPGPRLVIPQYEAYFQVELPRVMKPEHSLL